MISGIYQILHIDSGRRYIGSSVNVKTRMRKHREQLRRGDHVNPALQNAWRAHGEEAFEFKQILVCRHEDLIMYENAIVGAYQANIKPHGYNSRVVAESCRGMPSKRMSHKPGDKHARLTLLEITKRGEGGVYARYRCDCGKETEAHANAVKNGGISSCGCIKTEMLQTNRARTAGEKFNRLTLVSPAGLDKNGNAAWTCVCDCGKEIVASGPRVAGGYVQSCGCLKTDAARARSPHCAGDKYNRLTLVEPVPNGRKLIWRCSCDCGGEVLASATRVAQGALKSCGCFRREDSSARSIARHAAAKAIREAAGETLVPARMAGTVFGKLTIAGEPGTMVQHVSRNKSGRPCWVFNCDCGDEITAAATLVANGQITSCGCLKRVAKGPRNALASVLGG